MFYEETQILTVIPFLKQYPVLSKDLPLTFISLEEWILIKLSGQDVIQYLHNQFTCDIKHLDKNKYSFSAHCNTKGQVLSNMYVFHFKNHTMAFIERLNIYEKQISEMKKYAIFSDVTITSDCNAILIGIAGTNARQHLSMFFPVLPDNINTIVHSNNVTLLHFNLPIERFLLIINQKTILHHLLSKSKSCAQFNNSRQWALLDIEAGYPIIEPITSGLFIPQSINMDVLQGISFNKGCYMGQESIARIQYRGKNKRALYCLSGFADCNKNCKLTVMAGDQIELQTNNQYWKNIGIILQFCYIKKDHIILIQTVLNQPIFKNAKLKITNTQTNKHFTLSILDIYVN